MSLVALLADWREDGPPQSLMWEDGRWAFRGLESSLREGPWGREDTSLCRTCPDTWDRSTGRTGCRSGWGLQKGSGGLGP